MTALRDDVRAAVPAWLEARLYVAAAFAVTGALVDRLEPKPAFTPLEDGLLAWDGTWYRAIADNGYIDADDPAVRFFPLWPLLGRFGGWLIGGHSGVALVVLANLLALAAAVLLHRLVLEETGDRVVSRRAVRIFALFPPAFVLVLAYSEALYITLALAVLLTASRRRWLLAAMAGYLAGLTRPVGSLLSIAVAVTAIRSGERRPTAALAVIAPVAGTLSFMLWSWIALDDFWAPAVQQGELRGSAAEPVTRLLRAFVDGVRGDEGELFHFLAGVLLVILTVVAIRRLSLPLVAYTVPSTLVLISAENLNSMERYALSAFPLVIAAALVSRQRNFDRWLVTASAAGLLSLTILALSGVYVP